jgi:hypothetical protein
MIFFKLARCGYTLRVTLQASYSPTQKNNKFFIVFRGDRTIQILVRIHDMAFSPHVYSKKYFSAFSLSKAVGRQTCNLFLLMETITK